MEHVCTLPSLQRKASIISGAGIFYGSISNAINREAKMAGGSQTNARESPWGHARRTHTP